MRLALPLALLLSLPGAARAADGPTVTCSGSLGLALQMGLVYKNGSAWESVAPASSVNVFNQAECFCDSTDLAVQIKATTPLNQGTQETFEVWVGTGCDSVVNRQGSTISCERISTPYAASDFWQGAAGPLYQPIPARSLISPVTRQCSPGAAAGNAIWFLFYTDRNNPDAICSILFNSQTTIPTPAQNVTAGSGDGAVTIKWEAPSASTVRPAKYQILCADAAGNPLANAGTHDRGYSVCTASGIKRRTLATAGTVTSTADGGTTKTDAGTSSEPLSGSSLWPDDDPLDAGVTDLATADASTVVSDGLSPTVGPFTTLDPRFICSDVLEPNVTEKRIDGLTNGQAYRFVVVGIDLFGNPSPSALVEAKAQPVEDLYRRFEGAGGKSQGFCFVATAARGSYEDPQVRLLRRFRDEVLAPTFLGREFIDWYYRTSPPLALYISTSAPAQEAARVALWPVVGLAWLALALGSLGRWLLFAAAAGLLVRRARRSRGAA